jgi:hypothetical protein
MGVIFVLYGEIPLWAISTVCARARARHHARGCVRPRARQRPRLVYERVRRVSTRELRTRRLEDAESSRPSKHCALSSRVRVGIPSLSVRKTENFCHWALLCLLRKYLRTTLYESTFVHCTKVLSYFRTKVRKYYLRRYLPKVARDNTEVHYVYT